MLIAGMSTRAVSTECNVNFSTISHPQRGFREFSSTSNRPHNGRPLVWHRVGERFVDVNVVSRMPHGDCMVWLSISYRQRTQLHFIDGNLNAPRHPLSFHSSWFSMIMHDPMSLEAENVPILPWSVFSSTCTTSCSSSRQYPVPANTHTADIVG